MTTPATNDRGPRNKSPRRKVYPPTKYDARRSVPKPRRESEGKGVLCWACSERMAAKAGVRCPICASGNRGPLIDRERVARALIAQGGYVLPLLGTEASSDHQGD